MALKLQQERPEQVLNERFKQFIFAGHPYERDILGTKQDVLAKALSADDRIPSRFVVDEDGQLLLLVGDEAIKSSCYPVRMEMFEPRCKNVGKYSVWSDKQVGLYYNALCNAWYEYCDQKRFVFCDCIY